MKVVYETDSGMVRWIQRGTGRPKPPPGCACIDVDDDGENPSDVYVKDEALVARPSMALDWHYEKAVGEVVIDNIPKGATVRTPNWEGTVDDGFVAWPVAEPGRYALSVECFPYHTEVINAEVT